jgi:uncharacterized LabA/DUF88 family protein
MRNKSNNFAYIDGANLHKGVKDLGWRLDYKKFRVWLREKYGVERAYIFLGYLPFYTHLYRDLQTWGYTVVFKPTILNGDGEVKGNCDAELVLQAVSDMYEKEYEKAVIVTGDGDFACLVKFLQEKERFLTLISPNHKRASVLLRNVVVENIVFLNQFKVRLEFEKAAQKEKAHVRDGTRKWASS